MPLDLEVNQRALGLGAHSAFRHLDPSHAVRFPSGIRPPCLPHRRNPGPVARAPGIASRWREVRPHPSLANLNWQRSQAWHYPPEKQKPTLRDPRRKRSAAYLDSKQLDSRVDQHARQKPTAGICRQDPWEAAVASCAARCRAGSQSAGWPATGADIAHAGMSQRPAIRVKWGLRWRFPASEFV